MKKLILLVVMMLPFILAKPAVSGKVTDMEWNTLDKLVVTYYSGSSKRVECTAYSPSGSPIGGGFGYPSGGVVRVFIRTPKKYVRQQLKVACRSHD